jgi:Fe-S-cluster-containing hydrogenase component 2
MPDSPPGPESLVGSRGDACWGELAERCLGCRTCTYDCPVRYCFDVRDRRLADGRIERLRCWDFCQGALSATVDNTFPPHLAQLTEEGLTPPGIPWGSGRATGGS